MINSLGIGDLISVPEKMETYRIVYINEELAVCCLLGAKRLEFKKFSVMLLLDSISTKRITHEHPNREVVDLSVLSDEEKQQFKRKKDICRELDRLYGPTYEILGTKVHKPELRELEQKYGINRETLRLIYIQYIQSGLDDMALLDRRSSNVTKPKRGQYHYKHKRPGREAEDAFSSKVIITDEIKKQFDEAIKERLSGRCKTYDSAYSWLVNKYYSQTYMEDGILKISPKTEALIPSKRQFTYYAQKQTTKPELDVVKTSKQEVRNDRRLLLSDTYNDALGPGDLVEIDAVEVDVALVSSYDRKQAIGRPIMYLMIDVFTRMIIAMAVSLHNNAMIALTNLFLNLSDNKYEFCAKYGHFINEHAWLSGIIPRRIRVDRGSDFKSDQFGKICEELGIDRQLVPGATGSLKGNIEQEFRTLHAAQKPHLDGRGVISQRHDSNHHAQAVLTLDEYIKMAVDFVLHHNTMACADYPLTADMIKNNVHAVPYELWQYGSEKYGAPRLITNLDMYRYTLMVPVRASLDRTGITSNELSYINANDQRLLNKMYDLQNKRERFEARIDPRDITNLYYVSNGKLMMASLNQMKTQNDGFAGMTLFEYQAFLKEKRRIRKEDKIRTQRVKNSLHADQEAIVQEALSNKKSGSVNTKGIRDVRNEEKQRVANSNSIANRIEAERKSNLLEEKPIATEATIGPKTTEPKITTKDLKGLSGFEAAMNMFESGE